MVLTTAQMVAILQAGIGIGLALAGYPGPSPIQGGTEIAPIPE